MIDEINSTELHTCLLEITLLPLAHYWHFWYGPLDAAIYSGKCEIADADTGCQSCRGLLPDRFHRNISPPISTASPVIAAASTPLKSSAFPQLRGGVPACVPVCPFMAKS